MDVDYMSTETKVAKCNGQFSRRRIVGFLPEVLMASHGHHKKYQGICEFPTLAA